MFALKVRSYFSLMAGTASPLQLCLHAKKNGYTHLALTDHNNLYGLPAFLGACRTTGITPIIGAEITSPLNPEEEVTCLVQNREGYQNLCSLLSRRHCDKGFALSKIPSRYTSGLFFLCSDPALIKRLHQLKAAVVADLGSIPTAKGKELRRWSKKKNVPAVFTCNSAVLESSDKKVYALLQAINNNNTLCQQTGHQPQPLHAPDIYLRRFAVWPEVIHATSGIGKLCTFTGPDFGVVMPPWQGSNRSVARDILREEAYKGARCRYGDDLGEPVVDRLEHELEIIEQMGFSSYFLVVRDIVHPRGADGRRRARRICGRGSGAASLVAYSLGITNVCPVRHNLYFERFLNPGRKDPPDIDIDFAWDERDQVLAEVLEKHHAHAAMICNHVYFQPRMAIRETAKAFGLPGYEISRVTKKLPQVFRGMKENLEKRINRTQVLQDYEIVDPWPEILTLAGQLVGIPRNLSVHPGGVVITPEKIDTYVPVELAPKGVPIIQWEKDGAEEMGLVKIDLLGNRSLGVIRDAVQNIEKNGGSIQENCWLPEEDEQTQRTVSCGQTMGCFYIESPAMRLLQQKAGSGDFEQLVLQSSIIRPAANEFVREYVRRLHGGEWTPLHPELEGILDETFGLMVYQEDVSKVAVHMAGFSHAKADGLRKILSKKDRERQLADYKRSFFQGCLNKGVSQEVVESLWSMIISFDGYSFCKPHSASYAKVSYQAAYLKTHYPAEFMAAVISNQGGFYSCFAYVSEAKRLGLTIAPPDINTSMYSWQGAGKKLQVGLLSIKGLSLETITKILQERGQRLFSGVADFFHRTAPAEDEATAMIRAGALDSLQQGVSREQLLWDLACFKQLKTGQKKNLLFAPSLPPPPELPPQSSLHRFRYEYTSLGFLCSSHPVTMFTEQAKQMVKGKDIQQFVGRRVTFAGWLLTGKIVSTKTGEAMEFLTFEDETASVEATFFPQVYRKYAHILSSGRGYVLTGLVEEDYGACTLTVQKAALLTIDTP